MYIKAVLEAYNDDVIDDIIFIRRKRNRADTMKKLDIGSKLLKPSIAKTFETSIIEENSTSILGEQKTNKCEKK